MKSCNSLTTETLEMDATSPSSTNHDLHFLMIENCSARSILLAAFEQDFETRLAQLLGLCPP